MTISRPRKPLGVAINGMWPFAISVRSLFGRIVHNRGSPESEATRALENGDELNRHREITLTGKAEELRKRFVYQELDYEECLTFYKLVVEQHGYFPYDWEYRILLLGLEREPGRRDLIQRLMVVKDYL